MPSYNKATIIGHIGRDPEVRQTKDGTAIANFSIATNEYWKDKSGEKREKTEWHAISTFGRNAEIAGEYLRKGSLAMVEGRLQTRKWTDKDGAERYTTEIVADRLLLLEGRGEDRAHAKKAKPAASSKFKDDDDIPF